MWLKLRHLEPATNGFSTLPQVNTYRGGPDERGHFGLYGGRFVAETLMPLILEVERAYEATKGDSAFAAEIAYYHEH